MSIFDTLYGFNPNVIQQPNYNLARTTTSIPTINPVGVTTDLVGVDGDNGAKQFSMRPNSRVALFDINDDIMFIKSTDSNNYPTIKKYRFTEVVEEHQNDTQRYVTIDEFNKLKEELLNGQQSIRESISAVISAGSADAKSAKPRTAKKTDADVQDGI